MKTNKTLALIFGFLLLPLAIIIFKHNPIVGIMLIATSLWCFGIVTISALRK